MYGVSINGIIMTNHAEVKKQLLTPPSVLIKTWCTLARYEDEEVGILP